MSAKGPAVTIDVITAEADPGSDAVADKLPLPVKPCPAAPGTVAAASICDWKLLDDGDAEDFDGEEAEKESTPSPTW